MQEHLIQPSISGPPALRALVTLLDQIALLYALQACFQNLLKAWHGLWLQATRKAHNFLAVNFSSMDMICFSV